MRVIVKNRNVIPGESKAWQKHILVPLLSPALPCSPDSQQKHTSRATQGAGVAPGTQLPSASGGPVPRRSWLLGGGVGKEPSTGPFDGLHKEGLLQAGKGRERQEKQSGMAEAPHPSSTGRGPAPPMARDHHRCTK